ncbi:bifunctional DNA-formamidopyrimidine glycosylase/DNA-(apurinic or apyrimidinic site) lyase [Vulgatibacter sp.]|uniref:bifunctional DNA-formamidopyrimidine glycosylase/DNA-(apurinic or apyrimidinic site) lyase n=1 Tax=Vulgatibacter sp. TaxID=1971226 RepID=UPI00356409EA
MPELPEVEFAARTLRRWLEGKRIEAAEASLTRIFRGSDANAFASELPGKKLEWIERRGKYLLLAFTKNVGLLAHLGMTGKWMRIGRTDERPSHVRASLTLEKDGVVLYRDPRLFGRIAVHPADRLFELKEIRALGPDPLVDGIDEKRLHERLHRTGRAVKVAIMDQAVIAGVGNIQATDALFHARIHPARAASSLGPKEVRALAAGIRKSIDYTLGLQGEGDAIEYVEDPGAENPFVIYGRAGHTCPRCTGTLEKLDLGGRTSAFCPHCQPA